jgi:hypothetical protein
MDFEIYSKNDFILGVTEYMRDATTIDDVTQDEVARFFEDVAEGDIISEAEINKRIDQIVLRCVSDAITELFTKGIVDIHVDEDGDFLYSIAKEWQDLDFEGAE